MSAVFRLIVHARGWLYRARVLPVFRLNHAVISVGNLTVGGTGKTPLVIALAERLRSDGFHPVILSRGYGRTSREILVVGSNWEEAGDEPFLIKQRLGNVPVVVGANRYRAGLLAETRQLGDIFILDDGFQHRRLHRDVDIVAIDPAEWIAGEKLLPFGRWREPKTAISRADAACVQEHPGILAPLLPIPSFTVRTEIEGLYKQNTSVSPETLKGLDVVAFAGIAKPERFFATLESIGIYPIKRVVFRDHHHYSAREIENLGGDVRITTEKDAVRLAGMNTADLLHLRIAVRIPEFEGLMSIVRDRTRV